MMYTSRAQRYKWKRKTLVLLYLIFILANVGEIFLALKQQEKQNEKQIEVRAKLEIPLHLPEDSKIEFTRSKRQLHL